MLQAIKNTLKRLSGKIFIFNPIKWYPEFLEGLSVEFGRVRDFKNKVLNSTVPNENMDSDSIDDHNKKYGISSVLTGTDAEKISRIVEKAALTGFPGPEWFEEQIQKAGFLLYVHENEVLEQNVRQYVRDGSEQYSVSGQYGLTARFTDPDTIPGKLVVGSPPRGSGKPFISQYGVSTVIQYSNSQYGVPDLFSLNPQPFIFVRTDAPALWGFYFTLSPFPNRLAVDETEFLELTQLELDYLCLIVIELKLQRNWCIVQAKAV